MINVEMNKLKKKLDQILEFIEDKNDVIYIDYPLHYNIGDILILLGGIEFFKFHQVNIKKFYSINNFNIHQLKKNVSKNTTLICHGGGNFGDIYTNHQKLREVVVKNFPENTIIFLPQTVHFSKKSLADNCQKNFQQHAHSIFFARDKPSYDYFKGLSEQTYLLPDMAHFLYKKIEFSPKNKQNTLYFLRRDIEIIDNQDKLLTFENSVDWGDIINAEDENLLKKIKRLMKLNKILKKSKIDEYTFALWYKQCWNLVNRSVHLFEQSNTVVTSRLHGHILTCLLERESILINNSYGKNKAYYEVWTNQISKFIE